MRSSGAASVMKATMPMWAPELGHVKAITVYMYSIAASLQLGSAIRDEPEQRDEHVQEE
jgi:hypothetical protein